MALEGAPAAAGLAAPAGTPEGSLRGAPWPADHPSGCAAGQVCRPAPSARARRRSRRVKASAGLSAPGPWAVSAFVTSSSFSRTGPVRRDHSVGGSTASDDLGAGRNVELPSDRGLCLAIGARVSLGKRDEIARGRVASAKGNEATVSGITT